MAVLDYVNYVASPTLASGHINKPRTLEVYIDFSDTGNQTAAVDDSLALFEIPAGVSILAAGIEQVTAGTATNTLIARVGTVAYSGTLAGDAAAGVKTVHADVSGGAPTVLASAVDFNLLSATAVRVAGIARAWVMIQEVNRPTGQPKLAARDTSTGLA
jgi:hypothetical protein